MNVAQNNARTHTKYETKAKRRKEGSLKEGREKRKRRSVSEEDTVDIDTRARSTLRFLGFKVGSIYLCTHHEVSSLQY